jgi:hypothetical protein
LKKRINYSVYKGIGRPIGRKDYENGKMDIMPVYGVPKPSLAYRFGTIFLTCLCAILLVLLLANELLVRATKFNEEKVIEKQQVLDLSFKVQKPFVIKQREDILSPVVEIKEVEREAPINDLVTSFDGEDREIVEYICEKWGMTKCGVAVAVAQSENFWNKTKSFVADRYQINTNGTIDVGIFQVNSVHFTKPGCSLAELVDPYKNIDCAYTIYSEQGWVPWVAYNNRNFLAFLK